MIERVHNLAEQSSLNSNYLYFAWFIPYAILVLLSAVVLQRFPFRLPATARWLFISQGFLQVLRCRRGHEP